MNKEPTHITPGTLAKQRKMRVQTVLAWISSGELEAVDHRSPSSSRPRWRISTEALADFDRRRSSHNSVQPKVTPRRRRKPTGVRQYV